MFTPGHSVSPASTITLFSPFTNPASRKGQESTVSSSPSHPTWADQDVEKPLERLDPAEHEFIAVGEMANKPAVLKEQIIRLEAFEEERQGLAMSVMNGEVFDGNWRMREASWYLRQVVWIG